MAKERIFICADHGLAIVYFLQSAVVPTLLKNGIEVVLLTDEGLIDQIAKRFSQPGLIFESLRLKQARQYSETKSPSTQYWLSHLRRFGASLQINTEALDSQIPQVEFESHGKRKLAAYSMRIGILAMRHFRSVRKMVQNKQMDFVPGIYTDLFEKYDPHLVVASTPGWRLDRYILREAAQRGIPTATVIVGWDNPSSYSLSGAPMDWAICWSAIQKEELVQGSDWDPAQVAIGGIPTYDGYFNKIWQMKREEYFNIHNLDPDRKLIAYASSFITYAPNIKNIEALVNLVENEALDYPSQLLIRLHPNHFLSDPLYAGEREQVQQIVNRCKHVKLVEPVPLGGEMGYYSGEDMPEKSSMMAYADIFTTVYSTMLVEAAIHERPIVSICIDQPGGWNRPDKFSLSLKDIGKWPTHDRFRTVHAGAVAFNTSELKDALNNAFLDDPSEKINRLRFIENEVTFLDGKSGERVADIILNCIGKKFAKGEIR